MASPELVMMDPVMSLSDPTEGAEPREPKGPEPLDEDQLRGIIEQEIDESVGQYTGEVARDQEKALEYYRGDPFGNEKEGRSSVVLRDVADTIDWMMPALVRIFFGSDKVVQYVDATAESESAGHGRRMTLGVNQMFREELRGFLTFHNWFKAALLDKNAAIKIWAEDVREPTIETYTGLTPEEAMLLLESEEVEPIEAVQSSQTVPDPLTGQPIEVTTWDLRIKRWRTYKRIRLEGVPTDEFLISRRAMSLEDAPFVAHRRRMTRSELFDLGIPWEVVSEIPNDVGGEYDTRRTVRHEDDEEFPDSSAERRDTASQKVVVYECYLTVDYDGDGHAELRRVLAAGHRPLQILENDYAEFHPFSAITPIPMPYKFYGRSMFDVVGDLQLIRSTLLRQILDNVYSTNHQRWKAVEGAVDLDALLEPLPGGIVPVENMDALEPLDTPQLPSWAFEMLQYLETVRETRTGVMRDYQGMNASDFREQTASGVSQLFEAAQQRVELIARIFAETGIRDLFRKIPRVLQSAGFEPQKLRVGDEWIDFNPAEWPRDMRVAVQVGLSPGQTEQRLQRLMLILGLQKEAMATWGPYLTDPDRLYNAVSQICEQAGFRDVSLFFKDPQGQPPPEPPPSPDEQKLQLEAGEKQAKAALDAQKLELERWVQTETMRLRQLDIERTDARERERMAIEERIRMRECELKFQQQRQQAQEAVRDGPGD